MNSASEASDPDRPCRLEKRKFEGWSAFYLSNGIVQLFVVPEIGGRIIQAQLGAHPFLYVNARLRGKVLPPEKNGFPAGPRNYGGSKVWPAPQGWSNDHEWPGPPDPIFDGGPYESEIGDCSPNTAALRMTSQYDEYTGVTFSREIRVLRGSAQLRIFHTMKNTSRRPVRWSIWQVTQQGAGEHLVVYVPAESYRQMFGDQTYPGLCFNPQTGILRLPYHDQVAKFAVKAKEGWLATLDSRSHTALAETFVICEGESYPDDAHTEFWINGHGTFTVHGDIYDCGCDPAGCDPYVETEVLSPLVALSPGEEYSFATLWHLTALDAAEVVGVNACAIIGARLSISRIRDELQVRGAFGVFQIGNLELVSICRNGKVRSVHPLGVASPLAPCIIDAAISVHEEISRISLRLRDLSGALLGTVDEAVVPLPIVAP